MKFENALFVWTRVNCAITLKPFYFFKNFNI